MSYVALTDSTIMASWIVSDYETQTLFQAAHDHPIFRDGGYEIYKYIGNQEAMQTVFNMLVSISTDPDDRGSKDIVEILGASSIYFDNGTGLANNTQRRSDFILLERYFH